MITAAFDRQDLIKINPLAVQRYLKGTGWIATKSRRPHIMFFSTERDGQEYEITLPLDRAFRDYSEAISMAVEQLAEVEKRTLYDIIHTFTAPIADIVKFRRIDTATENGTLPLEDGPSLFKNIRKALYAVVCDSLQPSLYHKRLHLQAADNFVKQCSFGQTEHGSYIATVICPFSQLDLSGNSRQLSLFDDATDYNTSFTRQVTIRLMRSLERIFNAIETDQLETLQNNDTSDGIVSGNLLEALLELNGEDKVADIEISTQWATVAPRVQGPHSVRFSRDYFPPLEKLIERIQSQNTNSSQQGEFVGRISLLQAEPDIQQRTNGEIILNTFDLEGKVIKAHVTVSPEEFEIAIQAIREGLNVRVKGVLTSQGRTKRLEYTSISLLDKPSNSNQLKIED